MQAEKLIETLLAQCEQISAQVKALKNEDLKTLTWKANENEWSVLECLQHLNLYGDFYLPQIEEKVNKADKNGSITFRSGLLGNYFAKSMLPKEKLNKMKTFKDKNPLNASLDKSTIDQFLVQQEKLVGLLKKSVFVDLNTLKITTSLSKLLSLKLGDAFQFYINHIIRHLKQIENIQSKQAK